MPHEFLYRRRVEFAETDMAGIAHFACFFRYAEEAEHAFLRSLGLSVHAPGDGSLLGFPRASARCEFEGPARFEDELEVRIWVRKKGARSIVYQYEISRAGRRLAKGETAVICCRQHPDGRFEAVPLSAELASRLEDSPRSPLEFR